VPEFFLRPDLANGELAQARSARDLLDWAESEAERAAPEQVYRHKEGRTTLRLPHAGRSWFLKLHRGVGWVEIIKNLLQLRLPVLGAANEYRAVAALQRVGVDTLSVAAYASRGRNPATRQSLIVTEDLVDTVSLEDYCANWASEPPPARIKMQLVRKLADSARRMHAAGINHRDFYICHFHLDESSLREAAVRCHLIDLHRAQLRQRTPMRWRVKDLAGLYFSAMDCGLTQRDLLRFVHHYSPGGLRQGLRENGAMWAQVQRKALQLYAKGHAETATVKSGSVDAR
jgi:heptose I phosphotransferase